MNGGGQALLPRRALVGVQRLEQRLDVSVLPQRREFFVILQVPETVGILKAFRPAFGLKTGTADERKALGKKISPINFISTTTAPTLIMHGDADKLVPFQQAESFIKKCEEHKVPARLVRKPKAGHAWAGMFDKDFVTFAEWFDKHLTAKGK